MKTLRSFPLIVALIMVAVSCNSRKNSEAEAFLTSMDNEPAEEVGISNEVIGELVQQIPSPVEISVLLKESSTGYLNDILSSHSKSSDYNTNFQKAVNLGIYGTDLGYSNVFEQSMESLNYLGAVKNLADELRLGQFFNLETFSNLARNKNNLDTLLLLTTENFNKINNYLREQKRANLSILLLTGGWVEALHIACQTYAKDPVNEVLREKIGEQKITLESLNLLLSYYAKNNEDMRKLNEDLVALNEAFDKVEINYTKAEPKVEVVNGVMVITDNSSSNIILSDEVVSEITTATQNVRNILTSAQI